MTQATFNTLVSAALRREIKFKTTEKSIMAADVTDAANKAVKKSKKQRSPFAVLWMSIQAPTFLGIQYTKSQIHNCCQACTVAAEVDAWASPSRPFAQRPRSVNKQCLGPMFAFLVPQCTLDGC